MGGRKTFLTADKVTRRPFKYLQGLDLYYMSCIMGNSAFCICDKQVEISLHAQIFCAFVVFFQLTKQMLEVLSIDLVKENFSLAQRVGLG